MLPFQDQLENYIRETARSAAATIELGKNLSEQEKESILSAVAYPIEAGGKRVRPVLTSLFAQACGASATHPAVLACAAAVELIHTYSLVHDDLPCMDNDDFRRGKPTTHKVFGEANALLVGDALLTHAFFLLTTAAEAGLPARSALRCVEILSRSSGFFGMIGGQWKDLAFTQNPANTNWDTLSSIHNLKTGALLGAACALGVVVGTAISTLEETPEERELALKAEQLGGTIGLVFQIVDDILDVTQTSADLGKTAGKDVAQDKLTAVKLLGIDGALAEARRLTANAQRQLEELRLAVLKRNLHSQTENTAWDTLRAYIDQLLLRTS